MPMRRATETSKCGNGEYRGAWYLPACLWVAIVACLGCKTQHPANTSQTSPAVGKQSRDVDSARIIHADDEPGNWMTYGRTYNEQRFSPLKQITDGNVKQLSLAWHYDLDTRRGQE